MAASGSPRRGYFEKRLQAAIDNPRDYVFVGVFDGEELAGFAFAKLDKGEFGKTGASASLDAIGVNPDHGLQGIGHRLLEEVEKVLRHKGVTEFDSQVDWDQWPLLSFFAHSGFKMAPRMVLTRTTREMPHELRDDPAANALELDYSSPDGDAGNALSHDFVPVRSMRESDLAKIISIDAESSGSERTDYFSRKQDEALNQSGVRVSLVAEQDGFPAGFIMARVDYGEFGRTSTEAVMDSIGVDTGFRGQGIGRFLMAKLMANLKALQVETVRTEVDWNDIPLIGYFSSVGFRPAQRISLSKPL
ncbi:GNAT family N-acetyltransferase [Ruegeria marisrubri]|nr:GNAT family N-acetyltransferase [Ruegeria marisrubri]